MALEFHTQVLEWEKLIGNMVNMVNGDFRSVTVASKDAGIELVLRQPDVY